MFRIRRVYDDLFPRNRGAVEQVKKIFEDQFPGTGSHKLEAAFASFRDPLTYRFRTVLFVAEDQKDQVQGFAVFSHLPDVNIGFLDYIASGKKAGGGVGGALYERLREEALRIGVLGLLFECLPDEASLCAEADLLEQNKIRLKFYERYGARPIAGTKYETPVGPADTCPPFLMYDDLGTGNPLRRRDAKKAVRAILRRKYGGICDEEYIKMVADSFRDDPVPLRELRYHKKKARREPKTAVKPEHRIPLVFNRYHEIHHVRERGYVEAPVRVKTILEELRRTNLFEEYPPKKRGEKILKEIHDKGYLDYFKRVCGSIPPGKAVYPYVFPVRNASRPPKDLEVRAGYYCLDTFTPLSGNAYRAAIGAVAAVLTAAEFVLDGRKTAYALVRPPGHHAERNCFGGFCYFNSAAAGAQFLSRYGKVAMLDIDYHHGNGQQDIFYRRNDVLTVSIHGHPSFAYPYFSGFKDETGEDEGRGYNLNIPLPRETAGSEYRKALKSALLRIKKYSPRFLVLLLGLDPAKGDPTGTWLLRSKDFEENGRLVAALGLPTLIVQEGGYDNRVLGVNARSFFQGYSSP